MRLRDRRRPAWVARLREALPKPHHLREHRGVAWLGPALHHPRVWHLTRRGVALGVAVGVFFGLMVPLGQILFAAVAAVVLRANLPVAALSTLVTNPFTVAPIYFAAYRLGQALLGGEPALTEAAMEPPLELEVGFWKLWFQRVVDAGPPLVVGLAIFATGLSLAAYLVVDQAWRLLAMRAWRRRREPGQGE
jgi:uncharacterized protein